MPARKPLIWRTYDAVERIVAPRVEDAVGSGLFLDTLGFAARARAGVARRVESRSRRLWHLINIPAASDVIGLRRQLGRLDHKVERVSALLEDAASGNQLPGNEPETAEEPRRAVTRSPPRAR